VMIGRAAPANPWIFRQIAEYTATGQYTQPTEMDRSRMIRTYFAMLIEEDHPEATGKMKQFASWFTHSVPGGAALRKAIYESKTEAAILETVEKFFATRTETMDSAAPEVIVDIADEIAPAWAC